MELTVEQMLAAEDESDVSLSAQLDAIRHSVTDGGVSVTVDLHGKLVDLRFDQQAMRLRAAELAAKIHQLTAQAAAAALAEGSRVLTDALADQSLIAELTSWRAR